MICDKIKIENKSFFLLNLNILLKIKFLIIIFYFYLFISSNLYSQSILNWAHIYPDTSNSFLAGSYDMALDNFGNIYITGFAEAPSGAWNSFCTIKYSSNGQRTWVSNY